MVEKVVTDISIPSFIGGVLVPAGTVVHVPDEVDLSNSPNLADPEDGPKIIPAQMAAIGPTGPNPTMPQQLPPGTIQTAAGYSAGGVPLLPEGYTQDIVPANPEGDPNKSLDPVQGDPSFSVGEPEEFDADAIIAGTIPEVVERLDGLSADQMAKVRAAEMDREKPREGVLKVIDAR